VFPNGNLTAAGFETADGLAGSSESEYPNLFPNPAQTAMAISGRHRRAMAIIRGSMGTKPFIQTSSMKIRQKDIFS
jgi:hypothetical protein